TAMAPFTGVFEVPLKMIGSAIADTGALCLLLFTARVFREHDRRAWAFVGAMGALLAVHTIGYARDLAAGMSPRTLLAQLLYWGAWSLALTGIAWGQTGFESLRYYALLRKRVALGLADPAVANRVLLWGLMGATALACVLVDTVLLYSGSPFARDTLLPTVTALAGITVSVYM